MVTAIMNAALFADWSLGNLFSATQSSVITWVKVIVGIIGVVLLGFGVYKIAKNLISHGKGQTSWVVAIASVVIGGMLMLQAGWDTLVSISKGGDNTVNNLGEGKADNAKFDTGANSSGANSGGGRASAIIGGQIVSFD